MGIIGSILEKIEGKEEKQEEAIGYRDITIVLDRSSSMIPLKNAVIEGFNEFFTKMKDAPGKSRWTMVQFDDPDSAKGAKEEFPNIVFEGRKEKDMIPLQKNDFKPRGSTALVDAVCKTIKRAELRTSGQPDVKPIVMIVTDGLENNSKEWSSEKMRELIGDCYSRGWDFQFLAANQDAWAEAKKYDIAQQQRSYTYDGMSVESGAIRYGSDSINSYSFNATYNGMKAAINSGMTGCFHMASGRPVF